jgi:hypothetical protein
MMQITLRTKGPPPTQQGLVLDHASGTVWRDGLEVGVFGRLTFRAIALIAARRGGWVSTRDLESHLYDDDPEGGPVYSSVKRFVFRVRPALMQHGICIVGHRSRGYRMEINPNGHILDT